MRVRRSIFAVLSLILCAPLLFSRPALAADNRQAEGAAIIQRAIDLTDLRQAGPYHMRRHIVVPDEFTVEREGTDEVHFSAPRAWRRDLNVTGYSEVAVFVGNMMYRTRSLPFTPPSMATDLGGQLRNLPDLLDFKVVRIFNQKIEKTDARCLYLEQRPNQYLHKRDYLYEIIWCFAPDTGLPIVNLSVPASDSTSGVTRIEFSEYKALGTTFVPALIQRRRSGKVIESATLESLEAGNPDAAKLLMPPPKAEARRWCDDMQGLRFLSGQWPDVPLRSHTGLELKYELTVDSSGNVTEVVPMQAKAFDDQIAIQTIRSWRWKPAMCGETAVTTNQVIDLASHFDSPGILSRQTRNRF